MPIDAVSPRIFADEPPTARLVVSSAHVDQARLIILLVAEVGAVAVRSLRRSRADAAPNIVLEETARREAGATACQRHHVIAMPIIQ